jgi:ribosomal-protein-alanine N-acetyltransferase
MSDCQARCLHGTDLPTLLSLEQALSSAPHWKVEDYQRFLEAEEPVRRVALVLERDRRLVGFAGASLVAEEAELESIFIAQEEQSKGAGSCLLHALLMDLRLRGAERVFLEVRASNERAIALYRRFSFVACGCRPNYYSSPLEDAMQMVCHLEPIR